MPKADSPAPAQRVAKHRYPSCQIPPFLPPYKDGVRACYAGSNRGSATTLIEHGSYGQCVRQISKSLVSHRACQLELECSRFSPPPDRSGPDSTCASVAGPQSRVPYLFRACGRRVVVRTRPSKLECLTDRRSPQGLGVKSFKRAVDRGWVAAFASYTRPARGTDK